jgi:hypothetical protein
MQPRRRNGRDKPGINAGTCAGAKLRYVPGSASRRPLPPPGSATRSLKKAGLQRTHPGAASRFPSRGHRPSKGLAKTPAMIAQWVRETIEDRWLVEQADDGS